MKKEKPNVLYFLIGQSGCGKDTQTRKLKKHFLKPIVFAMGDQIRDMLKKKKFLIRFWEFILYFFTGKASSHTLFFPKRMKAINDRSERQPSDWAVYFTLCRLQKHYTGSEDIVINGSPRSKNEVDSLARLIESGYLPKAKIIVINVSDETAFDRLMKDATRKKRVDTNTPDAIRRKLSWYKDVRSAINYARDTYPKYFGVIEINGEQSPNLVSDEIFEKVFV